MTAHRGAGSLRALFMKTAVSLLLIASVSGAVFFARKPIVVVSDLAFESLYGERRAASARFWLSVYAFRPVFLAYVSENAQPQSAAESVLAVSGRRGFACALVPVRYRAGAAALVRRGPVVLVGESFIEMSDDPEYVSFAPDRLTDLYRAGRIAALFPSEKMRVLRMDDRENPLLTEAFSMGLRDGGYSGVPLVLRVGSPEPPAGRGSPVSVDASFRPSGVASDIVFSWSDPAFLPKGILAVFDDSLYACAIGAYRARGGEKQVRGASAVAVSVSACGSLWRFLKIQAAAHSIR